LLFVPSLPSLYKHRFLALAAVLLLPLPCPLYLFLRDAHLGRLRPLPAPLPEPPSDHLTLLLYEHPYTKLKKLKKLLKSDLKDNKYLTDKTEKNTF
jgi:hypothetical protein